MKQSPSMPDLYKWETLSSRTPTQRDFDPDEGDLDAKSAWNEFGEKTLDQAYEHFVSNPLSYQEDFMFMGPAAFCYYFPVVERYLWGVEVEHEFECIPAWILARGFIMQLDNEVVSSNSALVRRLAALTEFILKQPQKYDKSPDEQARILEAWSELGELLRQRISNDL